MLKLGIKIPKIYKAKKSACKVRTPSNFWFNYSEGETIPTT